MMAAIYFILLLAAIFVGGCADFTAYKNAEWHHYTHEQEKWGP